MSAERTIPATATGPVTEDRYPVLLCVHSGTATVETAGVEHLLSAGQAIWVPPGVRHRTRAAAGAVVFPVIPRTSELPEALSTVRTITIPPPWWDWMIHQYIDGGHIEPHVHDALLGIPTVLGLVAGARSSPDLAGDAHALPLPSSREALNVARALLRQPGSFWTADAFAAREKVSVKTLQRQFRQQTGMAFSDWRARARIVAAAGHLATGRAIGWTGRQVGYATPAGFTRAFQRHAGVTPSEYARRARGAGGRCSLATTEVVEQAAALVDGHAPTPPGIPLRRTWSRAEEGHFLLWMYRGQARARIGAREFRLRVGEAIWIPAGMPYTLEYRAGAIAIPVGDSFARVRLTTEELTVFSFPSEAERFLLHTSIVSYTLFRSDGDRSSYTEDLFRAQFAGRSAGGGGTPLTGAIDVITRTLHRDPADPRSLAEWAAQLRLEPHELRRQFRSQTGEAFPRWRAQLRMFQARELLRYGDHPGEVAKRLGYASAAAFANAFAAAHGMSARQYRSRAGAEASEDR